MKNNDPLRSTSSGSTLEGTVKSIFSGKGFEVLSYSEWNKDPNKYGQELLLTNVPYTSIYEEKARTEFLLISSKKNLRIRIECKWQQVSGSVDEKFPYLYLNIIEAIPEDHMIVIIEGDGFKPGAIRWFKKVIAEKKYAGEISLKKNIEVMNLKEFMTWANNVFRH
ncbi:MAG: 4-diphosphocytidyl-2C-methyl-D-erythritol kinase [candidate division Zixibacteria bacterium]|nr:4-diphosphocytidyl-2C-methyl-D-erythritol kinase [candidate division Zixibacteria bacterium]